MPDKFHAQLRHALRIPILLERENAQEQIVIRRQQVRAARTRRPNLRRDELDDLRIPFRERIVADVFLDRVAEAQVEPAVIHADDDVRLAFDGEREQLVEQPPELEIIFQHIGNADDRMLRQVKRQFDSGGGHLRAARAEECCVRQFAVQRGNQFRREQISARLTSDEHEGFWFHGIISTQRRKANHFYGFSFFYFYVL